MNSGAAVLEMLEIGGLFLGSTLVALLALLATVRHFQERALRVAVVEEFDEATADEEGESVESRRARLGTALEGLQPPPVSDDPEAAVPASDVPPAAPAEPAPPAAPTATAPAPAAEETVAAPTEPVAPTHRLPRPPPDHRPTGRAARPAATAARPGGPPTPTPEMPPPRRREQPPSRRLPAAPPAPAAPCAGRDA